MKESIRISKEVAREEFLAMIGFNKLEASEACFKRLKSNHHNQKANRPRPELTAPFDTFLDPDELGALVEISSQQKASINSSTVLR
jgi:hypothetical protein